MKRGRSTGAPTKAQQERFEAIKEIGCIVARIRGLGFVPCEIHHLTVGGKHGQKRRGHDFTVGLNPWSHRGVPFDGTDGFMHDEKYGPSYTLLPRFFRSLYPDSLLIETQNEWIEKWKRGEV